MIRKKKNFKSSNIKVREGPKICRRKFNFELQTKNKKEGGGSKYVGEY